MRGGQTGAVSFIQFFGSALQVMSHFVPGEGSVRFEPLPPPTQDEAERLMRLG
ncbi:hypothetical protein [Cystobacter ferrugineus]|uniref:hypothetical protein n=1 Tax=Cystobacter ferrugineus TaxID=83449 RepID=UPI0016514221|nr:hypothetical protein [Cystobacter ferrugineus]